MSSQGAAGPGRKATWRSDVAEGWRLFMAYAVEVVTPRRRIALFVSTAAVGTVVSAIADVVYARVDMAGTAGTAVLAFATGLFLAQVLSWILMRRWLPPRGEREKRQLAGALPGDFADDEIRRAWAEGRQPTTPVAQRLAAAERARQYREIGPRYVYTNVGMAKWFVPFMIAAITLQPRFGGFFLLFGSANTIVTAFRSITSLARTTAAIETAPDVPDHLEPDGRRRRSAGPHKVLGTDHPDDYT